MKTLVLMVLVSLLAASYPAEATIRYVSATGGGQYTTLSAAYNASSSGDTVLVGPGSYTEPSGITQIRRLVWIGAGWDQTVVAVSSSNWTLSSAAASRTEFEGMRINGTLQANGNPDSIAFRRCLISSTSNVFYWANQTGRIYVEDCILIATGSGSDLAYLGSVQTLFRNCVFAFNVTVYYNTVCFDNPSGNAGTMELYNNVFIGWRYIFNLVSGSQPVIAFNNVFFDWGGAGPSFGTYPGSSTFDYNASSGPAAPGTNGLAISTNPFVNYNPANNYEIGISDLHLDPTNGEILINTGHPSLSDLDGSRSDFGIYGGPHPLVENGVPNYPWAVNIVLTPNLVGQGTPVNATATGRVGPQY